MIRFLLFAFLALQLYACSTETPQPHHGISKSGIGSRPGEDRSKLLQELAGVERSFAAMSVAQGMRKAFIHYFAANGYNFDGREDPIKPRQDFPKLPPQKGKPRYQLDWFPVFTDVAQAGDMGFNTGPYVVRDSRGEIPPSHGYFFSVWERQTDGNLRVTVDMGTATGVPDAKQKALGWMSAAGPGYASSVPLEKNQEIDLMRKLEHAFAAAILDNGLAKGYGMYLHSEARLHRDSSFPVTGIAAIMEHLSGVDGTVRYQPTLVSVSASGDLGYSWGKYLVTDKTTTNTRGHYCHVWKRNFTREWKLVADIQVPITPS